MELLKLILLFLGGIAAGLYASTVGGGGLVSFPILILAGLPTPLAIGTNRLSAVLLELSSAAKFYKEKYLDLKLALLLGIIAAAGSVIGSVIVSHISARILNVIVAVLLLSVAIILLKKRNLGLDEERDPVRAGIVVYVSTFFLGIYGGFFGTGFGTFMTLIVLLTGMTFLKSAAVARFVGFVQSLAAAIIFIHKGLINYPSAISLGIGMAVGSWIGIGIAVKKGNTYIRGLFLVLIAATVVKLLIDFF